jgi:hypothetical protein
VPFWEVLISVRPSIAIEYLAKWLQEVHNTERQQASTNIRSSAQASRPTFRTRYSWLLPLLSPILEYMASFGSLPVNVSSKNYVSMDPMSTINSLIAIYSLIGQETHFIALSGALKELSTPGVISTLMFLRRKITNAEQWLQVVQTQVLPRSFAKFSHHVRSLALQLYRTNFILEAGGVSRDLAHYLSEANGAIIGWTAPELLDVIRILFEFDDQQSLDCLKQVLLGQNAYTEDALLHKLLTDEAFWNTIVADYCKTEASMRWVSELAQARIDAIRGGVGPATNSWSFPYATIADHPEVTEFLRSERQSLTLTGFNGIAHARNFAAKHFAYNSYGRYDSSPLPYSVSATTGGTGRNAYVTLTKT